MYCRSPYYRNCPANRIKSWKYNPGKFDVYKTPDGKVPFGEWLDSARDRNIKARIKSRFDRVQQGNLGDIKSVGEGVFELRINYGPGYRVYFGQVGLTIVVILVAGDKSTQEQDIRQAIVYWEDYERRESADK